MYKLAFAISCTALVFSVGFATAEQNTDEKLQDPTRPIGYGGTGKRKIGLNLQAIFYGNGRKEAIINGKMVKEGDVVAGKRVVSIRSNEIVYSSNGGRRVLKLRPSIFKK